MKTAVKLVAGFAVSAIFLFFSMRGVNLSHVWTNLHGREYGLLVPVALVFGLTQIVRSIRWGVTLSPIKRVDQRTLIPITCVGSMGVILIPMRMGELIRPYLLKAGEGVPMSSGLATILVERTLDLSVLLCLLFFGLSRFTLPYWAVKGGFVILPVIILEILFITICVFKPGKVLQLLNPMISRMPNRVAAKIKSLVCNMVDGLKVISSPVKLLYVLVLTFAIWIMSTFGLYLLFQFCDLHFGMSEAMIVMAITALGISLPSAPGLIGNFQFGCIIALSLCNVPKADSFTFAMVYYCMGVGINIFLGLLALPFTNIPSGELLKFRETN